MDVQILVDEKLIEEARKLIGASSDSEVVEEILSRFIEGRRKHKSIIELAGQVEFYPGFDPKSLR